LFDLFLSSKDTSQTRPARATKTIAQRISELEDMVASFFTGAAKTASKTAKTGKASAKRGVKRAKAAGTKRVAKAKRVLKRTARTARRKAAAIV